MKLEVGKKYLTRHGKIVEIKSLTTGLDTHPIWGYAQDGPKKTLYWTSCGAFEAHPWDLVSEYKPDETNIVETKDKIYSLTKLTEELQRRRNIDSSKDEFILISSLTGDEEDKMFKVVTSGLGFDLIKEIMLKLFDVTVK